MKTAATIIIALLLARCSNEKEIQIESGFSSIIKIDTVYRLNEPYKKITWKGFDRIEYIQFAPMSFPYAVGHLEKTLLKK